MRKKRKKKRKRRERKRKNNRRKKKRHMREATQILCVAASCALSNALPKVI